MTKKLTILTVLIISFMFSNISFAQTILSAGDLMFIGINADENTQNGSPADEEFLVLLLVDVTSGTEIYFTDMGYTGNSSPFFQGNVNNGCGAGTGAASDGIIKWEATSAVNAGTQILFRVKNTLTTNVGSVSTIVETATSGRAMDLSASGETIHALQGTLNGSNQFTSVTMISSLRIRTSWDATVTTCQFNSLVSEDPGTGFEFEWNSSNPNDNGYYSGSMLGDKATLQTNILNTSNWTFDNTTVYDLPISGSFPVPVELTSFTALILDNLVELNWNTATEVNNYGFEIERSERQNVRSNATPSGVEEKKWEKVGFVLGYGNSSSPKDYSFVDDLSSVEESIISGRYSYRLKQIDFDGTFEYSHAVEISLMKSLPTDIVLNQNYPNPFNPNTVISYTIPTPPQPSPYQGEGEREGLFVSLKIYDMLGNEIEILVNEIQAPGSYTYNFNSEGLASGTYIYKLTTDNYVEMKKMLLIK